MSAISIFLALMVPATVLLGINDILIRRILREGRVDEQMLIAFEFFTSGLLVAIPLGVIGIPEIQPGFWSAALTTAILNVFGQWAWYAAFRREEASLVSPLRLLTPPLVIMTGYFVLREVPSLGGIAGITLTIFGLLLLFEGNAVLAKTTIWKTMRRPGIILGILGAFSFAASFPFDKKAVVTSSALFAIVVIFLTLGFLSAIFALIRSRGRVVFDFRSNGKLLITLPFLHFAASILSFSSLNYALAAYAASVKRLWSFWAVLFSGKFLGEQHIGRKLLATGVMLLGIIITAVFG